MKTSNILAGVYLAAIILANISSATFGPAASVVNAFLLIGLVLVTRDALHDAWQGRIARNMALLILAGGATSYAINHDAGRIAVASFVAFTISELLDATLYQLLRHHSWYARTNGSNVLGAAADSALFAPIAFGGFPVAIMLGQFVAKVLGGVFWSFVIAHLVRVRKSANY